MYRYFLVHDDHMPKLEENYGVWHAVDLGSHGNAGKGWHALVLHDSQSEPHGKWVAFPRVVDHKTPVSAKLNHKLLADVGVQSGHTTLDAADALGAISKAFVHP